MAPANSFSTHTEGEIPRKFAEAATRALGRYVDPWFNPKYISPAIQQAPKSPAINSVGPAVEQNSNMATAKENLIREKLYTTFQGGQLRFLPMDDGITDETPEMRSEYLKMFLKEPSIKSAMLSKIISVISSKMSIEPASEDPMDKEASKWVFNILTNQKGGIRKMGENILLFSCVSGHALNEKVYHVEKKKQFLHLFPEGYIGLKQLKVKKPEDYRLEVDQFRNIRGVWSNRSSRRFDPSYFVITSFMPMYENPAGTSDLRSAIRAYNLILMAQQLRSIWTEQFSMPYMEGQYDKNDPDAKAFVEAAIQHLRGLGWYVAPTGTTIRAIEASTKGETEFQAQIDDLRKEIYLSIVGSYLQAIEGDTQGGAGDSSVHRTTFELFQWYLCEVLAESVNDQIIPDLMGMNFSGLENPRISFAGTNAGDLLQSIAIRQAIKVLGIDQSKKAIRREFEVDPPLDDVDKLAGEAPAAAPMPGMGLGLAGLNGQDGQQPPQPAPEGGKSEGEAPDPLAALKLSEKPPQEGQYANGSAVLWQAMKFFDRGILSDVALSKEMRTGPDGFTDYGTMMRTARYHGVLYRDIDDPAIFDMEKEINHHNRLILTTMDDGEDSVSFCLISRADLKNDEISVLHPDGEEERMTPEDFLDRWPGKTGKRRAVVLSTENDVETPKDDKPAKHSETDEEEDDYEGDGDGGVPGSGVGPRNPVHEKDIPAGPDGRDTYTLLNLAVEDGREIVTDMARKAATRMIKSGNTDEFFNESEVQAMADSLEECLAPADLLGRASVLLRLEKAKQMSDKVERFSEQPIGLAQTFAERRLRPMKPSRSLEYFKSLVPSMNLKEEKWLDTLKRKTFTMAEATNKTILERVHKAITKRIERGDNVSGPQAIEDILAKAGIHPRNPQYPEQVWRTNFMDIHNIAAEEQRTDPDVVDDFPVWRYMGIDDGRQSEEHGAHFEKYYPSKVSFFKIRGDRRWNCRCQGIPVYKDEWAKLKARGAKIAKFSEATTFAESTRNYDQPPESKPYPTSNDWQVPADNDNGLEIVPSKRNTQQLQGDDTSYEQHTPSQMSDWKESDHPRADDGKFGSGGKRENLLSKEGRDELIGTYPTPGGKKIDVWLKLTGQHSAKVTLLRRRKGDGTGSLTDILPDVIADLKSHGITHVGSGMVADDDRTGTKARERLFAGLAKEAQKQGLNVHSDNPVMYMSEEDDHDYCSTQFELPHAIGLRVQGLGERIRDEDLHEKGREDDPHVTLLYGIHDPADVSKIGDILRGQPVVVGTLRRSSVFSGNEEYDVVKLNVDSPELHVLRDKVAAACPHTETHPYYQPHVTLAYVKKGMGQKYADMLDLEGEKIKLGSLMFCDTSEGKTQFKIGENLSRFTEIWHGPKPPSAKGWQEMQPGPRGGKRWKKVESGGGKPKQETPSSSNRTQDAGKAKSSIMTPKGIMLSLKKSGDKAWNGKEMKASPLPKMLVGAMGEAVATAFLKKSGITDVKQLGLSKEDKPFDMVSLKHGLLIECKAGGAGVSNGAQQWRLTIGEPGEKEKSWLANASKEEKAKHNEWKMKQIELRKKKMAAEYSKTHGRPFAIVKVTCIINPDTKKVDVYRFDGLHRRIGWTSEFAQKGYKGSYEYEHASNSAK